jgi:hypothetical protein
MESASRGTLASTTNDSKRLVAHKVDQTAFSCSCRALGLQNKVKCLIPLLVALPLESSKPDRHKMEVTPHVLRD